MSWRYPTIRTAMAAIALVAAILGLIASEQWRWGHPRRVPFDQGNALRWMATVIQSDFRKYDGGDVQSLIDHVARSGLLDGKTRGQIIDLLGPPESPAVPRVVGSDDLAMTYVVGTVPSHIRAGPPTLTCLFNGEGRCFHVFSTGSQ